MLETVIYPTAAAATILLSALSGLHALLHKRDPRSQLGWVVVCFMLPGFGAVFYWSFGVNRIRTRARKWQELGRFAPDSQSATYLKARTELSDRDPVMADNLLSLLQISRTVTGRPLLGANRVLPLYNGEGAYPEMIAAIDGAKDYVLLCTYLFDTDAAGRDFIDALVRAGARGVEVRVLVDAIGERYARPRASKLLRDKPGVKVARFLPLALSLRGLRVNLRNHRKVLVVDGETGFTGGMNIGSRHMVDDPSNDGPTADVHFRVEGPAVYALEETFIEDWYFTTGKTDWSAKQSITSAGDALCRGIKDGPNGDLEKLQWILVGAMTCARRAVKVMTPYFIPSRELLAALNAAALRGAQVEIIIPKRSNLPFVDWACHAMLGEVMQHGIRVYMQPAPFNHSKLLIVDDYYVNLGSANLDPRSLRLNFEFNLEVYDAELGGSLAAHFEHIRRRSVEVTPELLEQRSLVAKLRDSFAKLFAPYL